MLYKIESGVVKEAHYGIVLARMMPVPKAMIDRAIEVANALEERRLSQGRVYRAKVQLRRKLMVDLREALLNAHHSESEDDELTARLTHLRDEFTMKMLELM